MQVYTINYVLYYAKKFKNFLYDNDTSKLSNVTLIGDRCTQIVYSILYLLSKQAKAIQSFINSDIARLDVLLKNIHTFTYAYIYSITKTTFKILCTS